MSESIAQLISEAQDATAFFTKESKVGDTITGTITAVSLRQVRDYITNKPNYWEDNTPQQQIVIVVDSDELATGDDDGGQVGQFAGDDIGPVEAQSKLEATVADIHNQQWRNRVYGRSQSSVYHVRYTRSTIRATALPPPRHRLAKPRRRPRCSRALNSVTSTRAPLAPIGCPSAMAPP